MSRPPLTQAQLQLAKTIFNAVSEPAPTEVVAPSWLRSNFGAYVEAPFNYLTAFAHPTFEGAETFATLAWFINEVTGASSAVSLSAAGVLAATAFIEQFCFITLSKLEQLRGTPFTGEQKNAVFTAALQAANLVGCVAEGLKFSAGMYGTLSRSGPLGVVSKLAVTGVGVFRFAKERMVIFKAAAENLKKLGFDSAGVDAFFNNIPFVNGEFYVVNMQDLITKNQPVIEGGLHGLAIYTCLRELFHVAADLTPMEMVKEHPLVGAATLFASLVAASGEKTAQRFDAEKAFVCGHREEVARILEGIPRQHTAIQIPEDDDARVNQLPQAPSVASAVVDEASTLLGTPNALPMPTDDTPAIPQPGIARRAVDGLSTVLTTTANVGGAVAGKIVDLAAFANPLYYLPPTSAMYKLIKILGNVAFGMVGANTVVNTPGAFQPQNPKLIEAIQFGFPLASGLAAFAQWDARQLGADHTLVERYGKDSTFQEKIMQAANNVFMVAPRNEGETYPQAAARSFCESLVPGGDAVTRAELDGALDSFARYLHQFKPAELGIVGYADLADDLRTSYDFNGPAVTSIKELVIVAFVENPDLATQIVLMNRAAKKMASLSGQQKEVTDVFPVEAKKLRGDMQRFFPQAPVSAPVNTRSLLEVDPNAVGYTAL